VTLCNLDPSSACWLLLVVEVVVEVLGWGTDAGTVSVVVVVAIVVVMMAGVTN
jgi:hypothetical protein